MLLTVWCMFWSSPQHVPGYLMSSLLDETIEAVVAGLNTAIYQRPLAPRAPTRQKRKTGKDIRHLRGAWIVQNTSAVCCHTYISCGGIPCAFSSFPLPPLLRSVMKVVFNWFLRMSLFLLCCWWHAVRLFELLCVSWGDRKGSTV